MALRDTYVGFMPISGGQGGMVSITTAVDSIANLINNLHWSTAVTAANVGAAVTNVGAASPDFNAERADEDVYRVEKMRTAFIDFIESQSQAPENAPGAGASVGGGGVWAFLNSSASAGGGSEVRRAYVHEDAGVKTIRLSGQQISFTA